MPGWAPFVGLTVLLVVAVLLLARQSTAVLRRAAADPSGSADIEPGLSRRALLANVAASQALVVGILGGAVVAFEIPLSALGLLTAGLGDALTLGFVLGLSLWLASEAAGRLADAAGLSYDESLRNTLAPDTNAGWAGLLFVVLPAVAAGEELLFRAALIGVPVAGFGLSPWALVAASSGAFALGHGAQGRFGIVATGALGAVLAAAFVLTGSLAVVVLAHYVVDVLEFLVHEA